MRIARSKEELLSLIAKLIVRGENRATTIACMKRSLDEFVIEGIKTTIDFHKKLLQTSVYRGTSPYQVHRTGASCADPASTVV